MGVKYYGNVDHRPAETTRFGQSFGAPANYNTYALYKTAAANYATPWDQSSLGVTRIYPRRFDALTYDRGTVLDIYTPSNTQIYTQGVANLTSWPEYGATYRGAVGDSVPTITLRSGPHLIQPVIQPQKLRVQQPMPMIRLLQYNSK